MNRKRKMIQRKVYYVCRCCRQSFAVIVALHRQAHRRSWNSDTQTYDIYEYSGDVDKIVYCMKCGTVDLRRSGSPRFLLRAYKDYPSWTKKFISPSLNRIRDIVGTNNNIREAEALDKEKAEREDRDRHKDQEGVPAEVRESFTSDGKPVLRVQRIGR